MSNKRLFLGIKQVLEKTFNQLTDEEKVGYVWFVYNNLEEEENKTALCKIYLGTKKYGEINDKVVSLETLDKIRTKIGLEENLELPDDFIFDSITSSIISIINNLTGINSNVQNIQDDIVEINKKTENIENCEFIVSEALNKTKDLIGLDKYFDLPLNYEYETIIDGIIDKAKKDDVYTKTEIDTKFRGSIHFIGTVDYFRNLEELSPNDGNVYMVRFHDDGTLWNSEFLYNGVSWIELGPIINFDPLIDKINEIDDKISANTQDILSLQSGVTTLETNLDETNANVELNKQDIVKISKNLTDINNTISEHSQEILDLQSGITILDDNIQNIVEIIDVVESGLSSLETTTIETNNEITSIKQDINTINNDIDVLQSGVTTLETNLDETNANVDSNKQEINTIKEDIEQLNGIVNVPNELDKEIVYVDTYDDLELLEEKSIDKIYLVRDTNKLYDYDGTSFIEITQPSNIIITDNLDNLITSGLSVGNYIVIHTLMQSNRVRGQLYLEEYSNKIQAVKCVREILGLGLKDAKDFVETNELPVLLKEGLSDDEMIAYTSKWAEYGVNLSYTLNGNIQETAKVTYNLSVEEQYSALSYELSNSNGFAVYDFNENAWIWKYYAYDDDVNDLYNIKLDTVISINYSELLTKRNNSQLISGQWYRITDYITTVANDSETQSTEHPFDILVQAIDINTLSEEAKAIKSERDTDGYFSDSDLNAWKIWYSIDNDTTRFAWADDVNGKGVIYHMIDEHNNDLPFDFKNIQFKRYAITAITSTTLTTEALNELINTFVYANNNGKCFATKDAYGNLIPTESNGTKYTIDENTFEWYYVFQGFYSDGDGTSISGTYDMSTHPYKLKDEVIEDMKLNEYGSYTKDWCDNNKIDTAHLEFFGDDEYYIGRQVLNNIVFLNDISYCYYYEKDGYWEYVTSENHSNRFKSECKNNTFGNNVQMNTFGNYCQYNTFGNSCNNNTFGNDCYSNTFGNSCNNNTFGNNVNWNTFVNGCYSNTFGNSCNNNTFGNSCNNNTFGNGCYSNTFGNNVGSNTFGNNVDSNTFGNNVGSNTFGNDYIRWCTIFDGVQYINVSVTTGPSSYLQNMQILNGTKGTNSSNKLQITSSYITSNRSFSTTIGRNSSGTLTSKNLMD